MNIDLQLFINAITALNWHFGKGDVIGITIDTALSCGSGLPLVGTVTCSIPITQKTRHTETRRFKIDINDTLHFLGKRRKIGRREKSPAAVMIPVPYSVKEFDPEDDFANGC